MIPGRPQRSYDSRYPRARRCDRTKASGLFEPRTSALGGHESPDPAGLLRCCNCGVVRWFPSDRLQTPGCVFDQRRQRHDKFVVAARHIRVRVTPDCVGSTDARPPPKERDDGPTTKILPRRSDSLFGPKRLVLACVGVGEPWMFIRETVGRVELRRSTHGLNVHSLARFVQHGGCDAQGGEKSKKEKG